MVGGMSELSQTIKHAELSAERSRIGRQQGETIDDARIQA